MKHKNLVLAKNGEIPSYKITDPIERANAWIKEQKEIQVLKQKIKEDKHKIKFFETITGSRDALDLGVIAKVINKKGYGRKKLFEFLKRKKILMQNNQPYQKYIDNGCFRTIETKFTKSNGEISINIKTLVYQRGVDLISKLLNKNL
ncbi:phage antirepressor KilAC domain-containing protein [Psychrilyobacter atlanticus]|uniref:phage antirepressor KilAC domain-containing protein n=1 Tax=Psychrilyobacter atlanticus TaxID=271091 RepID=UPI0003FE605F|nr:phage antirepressor KilAC domain-containing protein [Psychrilyobacter atlanticus]